MKKFSLIIGILLLSIFASNICYSQNYKYFNRKNFSIKYPNTYAAESEVYDNMGVKMVSVTISTLDEDLYADYGITYTDISNPEHAANAHISELTYWIESAMMNFKQSEGLYNTKDVGPYETTFKNKRAAKITFSTSILGFQVYGEIISYFDKGHLVMVMKMHENKSLLNSGDFKLIEDSITF